MRLISVASIAMVSFFATAAVADEMNPAFLNALEHYARTLEADNIEPSGCLFVAQMAMMRLVPDKAGAIPDEAFERANEALKKIKLEPDETRTCLPISNPAVLAKTDGSADKGH